MSGAPIAVQDLRERARSTVFWLVGILALVAITIASYPAVRDNPALSTFAEDLPEFVQALVGDDLVSPAGYLNSQMYLSALPILFLILAIGRASSTLAGEEQDGTLELTLAHPVPRTRLLVEKFAALAAVLGAVFVVTWLSTALGAPLVDMDISVGAVAAGTSSVTLLALAFGAVTLAVGAATGRRGLALGVGAGLAAVSFVLYGLAPLVESELLAQLSLWEHALGADPIANGFDLPGTLVLVVVTVAAFGVAIAAFSRRDLGTA